MKKGKIALIAGVLLIAAVLFLPIPRGTYDDGGTREYAALTYKIVVWNKLFAEVSEDGQIVMDGRYHKTSVFWYPDNRKSIDELWKIERAKQ